MRIKSYFVDSVAVGIAQARMEMGDDAVMILARNSPDETSSLGKFEVVFGANQPEQVSFLAPAKPGGEIHTGQRGWKSGPIVFVGPAGSGKTLAIMKIAMRYGFQIDRKVRIVSLDAERIGAREPLHSFGGILNVQVDFVRGANQLRDALTIHTKDEMILVDTPGFGVQDSALAQEAANWIHQAQPSEVHLVLPATSDLAYLHVYLKRFEVFHPQFLLFTRVDEMESADSLVRFSRQMKMPLSLFGTGRNVLDDLKEPEEAPWLLTGNESRMAAVSAA